MHEGWKVSDELLEQSGILELATSTVRTYLAGHKRVQTAAVQRTADHLVSVREFTILIGAAFEAAKPWSDACEQSFLSSHHSCCCVSPRP